MEEVTDKVDFQKLKQFPPPCIYIFASEGALGKREQKSSPTDVLKVRQVFKHST